MTDLMGETEMFMSEFHDDVKNQGKLNAVENALEKLSKRIEKLEEER